MRTILFSILLFLTSTLGAAEKSSSGEGSGAATRDASALSMMGWGLGLAVGIGTLFALLDNNPAGGAHAH